MATQKPQSAHESTPENTAEPSGALYRLLWRWHLYAGIVVSPFLIILAITGAIYLFPDPIEGLIYGKKFQATPAPARPVAEQVAAALAPYSGATLRRYSLPNAPDRPAEVIIKTEAGQSLTVFVDAAKAEITGHVPSDQRLMSVISTLHGELMLGQVGDFIVELCASWGFILLISGLYLWWPRPLRNRGVFVPKTSKKGARLFREWHAVGSLYIVLVVGFLILSGLPWAGFWGGQLAKFGTISPALSPSPNFHAPPSLDKTPTITAQDPHAAHKEDQKRKNDQDLPWAVRMHKAPLISETKGGNQGLDIAYLYKIAKAHNIAKAGLRIILPSKPSQPVNLSFVPDKAEDQRTIFIHPKSGEIIQNIGWRDYSPLAKVVEWGTMVHLGRQYGLINQLILLSVCLMFVGAMVMGLMSWWIRRPKAQTGAPLIDKGFRPPLWVIATAVLLGIAFPLAGLSMILVLMFEIVFFASPPKNHL